MSALSIRGITRSFGPLEAVRPTDLEIASGEFFAILGPSGCGKTTLLRMIAGYERPDAGAIHLGGTDITSVKVQDRGIGMVFQNYALFPHMTVFENVAFGLRARKAAPAEVQERVMSALESVRLPGKSGSSVTDLSGGEQQRVAVARALVIRPRLLLFDEPLSNLDAALRLQTREEIRSLQRSTGITTVYVTHDQGEAMSLADRIAVMRDGRVEQSGAPPALYDFPANSFVAEFLGGAARIDGELDAGRGVISWSGASIALPGGYPVPPGGAVVLSIKPEAITFARPGEKGDLEAKVISREYTGFTPTFRIMAGRSIVNALLVSTPETALIPPGACVSLRVDWRHCHIYPAQT